LKFVLLKEENEILIIDKRIEGSLGKGGTSLNPSTNKNM